MKRMRAVCIICKNEWDDMVETIEGYHVGFSICNKCGDKNNY